MAAVVSCTNGSISPPAHPLVIDHVTVLDGRGGPAITNARVIVRGSGIASVTDMTRPVDIRGEHIDGRGRFLVPGFIDMHAHLLFPRCNKSRAGSPFDRPLSERALQAQLAYGITTVRSPATPTEAGLHLRDQLNAGEVRGPRAFASAELINGSSLTESQLRDTVRRALPYKPDFIKAYSRLTQRQTEVLVDEAHRHSVPVIGHLQRTSWEQGVAAGVDHLTHTVDWATTTLPEALREGYEEARRTRHGFRSRVDWLEAFDPEGIEHQSLLRALKAKRVSVDLTLIAYDAKFRVASDRHYRDSPALSRFPELQDDWTTCDEATQEWTSDDFRRWKASWPKLLRWVRRMHDAGVLLVTGTDLTNEWIAPGEGLHQEFELLASAGLTGDHILRMTGANAAEALRRDDIGIIEAGRRADLVLLAADPRITISNTRSILWVMQGGRIVVRPRHPDQ